MIPDNKIYLSVIRDGDKFKVVDQDGRECAHITAISMDARVDDATSFTISLHDHDSGNRPHIG
jgi:hypothetical protein